MQPVSLSAPLFTRLAGAAFALSQRHWRFVLIAMLASLHVAVFRGAGDPWARALLLAHLGLLLLWQPFLRAEQPVSALQGLALAVLALALLFWPGWWLLAFWVVVLAGLVGGKVYQQHARWQRRCYLVVLAYLLALLAVAILPEIAPRREIGPEIRAYAEYVLPLAFLLIALFPAISFAASAYAVREPRQRAAPSEVDGELPAACSVAPHADEDQRAERGTEPEQRDVAEDQWTTPQREPRSKLSAARKLSPIMKSHAASG